MRIIFMGTPEFAVPSLKILVENNYQVVAVITATDKYGGRGGKKLLESPVKQYAVNQGIPVLQPANLKHPDFIEELASYKADLQVVVAFRMLPEVVWAMPGIGTFNLHGSLLPKYRGAAPINWAIINGDSATGVTTFFIKQEIDTGSVILQKEMEIAPNDTAGDVHDRMMMLGAEAVLETVQSIEKEDYTLTQQDDSKATKAPKIFFEDCRIDFNLDLQKVHDFVRGMSPYPGAWTMVDEKVFKILRAEMKPCDQPYAPGVFKTDDKNFLKIATPNGFLNVLEVQMQGKKKMAIKDFLNGFSFESLLKE